MDTISAFNTGYEDEIGYNVTNHRNAREAGGEERKRNRYMIVICAAMAISSALLIILDGPRNYLRDTSSSFYSTDERKEDYGAFLGFQDYATLTPYGSELIAQNEEVGKDEAVNETLDNYTDNEVPFEFFESNYDDVVIQEIDDSGEPDTSHVEESAEPDQEGEVDDGKLLNETDSGEEHEVLQGNDTLLNYDNIESQEIENSEESDMISVEESDGIGQNGQVGESELNDMESGMGNEDLEDDDKFHYDDIIIEEIKNGSGVQDTNSTEESDVLSSQEEDDGKGELLNATESGKEDGYQFHNDSVVDSEDKGNGETPGTSLEEGSVISQGGKVGDGELESGNWDDYQLDNDETTQMSSGEDVDQNKHAAPEILYQNDQVNSTWQKEEEPDDVEFGSESESNDGGFSKPDSFDEEEEGEQQVKETPHELPSEQKQEDGESIDEKHHFRWPFDKSKKENEDGEDDEQNIEEKLLYREEVNGVETEEASNDSYPSSSHSTEDQKEGGAPQTETKPMNGVLVDDLEPNATISQADPNIISEGGDGSKELFEPVDSDNENLFGPSDYSNNGKSKYPEYVVQQKQDPLYPGQTVDDATNVANQATTSTSYDYTPGTKAPIIQTNIANEGTSTAYEYSPVTKAPTLQTNVANQATSTSYEYTPVTKAPVIQSETSTTTSSFLGQNQRSMELKFGDVTDPLVSGHDVPFFWYIPRTAATSLQTILTRCQNMVVAGTKGSENGVALEPALRIVEPFPHENFLNVDLRTPEGIERASRLGAIESQLVDVVFASRIFQVSDIFHPPNNQGRCFTMMRHPVERAVSLFYYLRNAAAEKSYDNGFKTMTIEEYANSDKAESDWMTRSLTQKLHVPAVKEEDVIEAKEFLRTKCLVGLTSKYDESKKRFERYFGWRTGDFQCEKVILEDLFEHSLKYQKVRQGSATYKALASRNRYDMMLYEYAMELFEKQGLLF